MLTALTGSVAGAGADSTGAVGASAHTTCARARPGGGRSRCARRRAERVLRPVLPLSLGVDFGFGAPFSLRPLFASPRGGLPVRRVAAGELGGGRRAAGGRAG
eukprot:854315-Prorocentrum_minimum.AAC.1